MRRALLACIGIAVFAFTGVAAAQATTQTAQATQAAQMSREEITAFAKVHIAVSKAHDSVQAELAQARNKKAEAQTQLQEKLRADVEQILHHSGMTEAEFRRKTYIVSTDPAVRKTFDAIVAELTGVPTPGQAVATAASAAMANLPAGPVGMHIGHVVGMFNDTPNQQGLLPTAMAEARTAAQHAALANRNPGNLDAMKLHAGHILNALDPTIVPMGPGLGYGVKKAATGIATHIELAAKAQGASPNVVTHSTHIATAARSALTRTDQIIALAKQLQAATSATDAAALLSQITSLAEQITAGADTNGDGRIGWQEGEGGLQQAEQHVILMLAAEKKPS